MAPQTISLPLDTLPTITRAAYYVALGPPRTLGRWTPATALVALGLYVREEHRFPPQRHLHNRMAMPSFDTVVALFGSPQTYYDALPSGWRAGLAPLVPVKTGPRLGGRPTKRGARLIACLKCARLFPSVDTTYNRICPPCTTRNAQEDGLWLTGDVVRRGGSYDDEIDDGEL